MTTSLAWGSSEARGLVLSRGNNLARFGSTARPLRIEFAGPLYHLTSRGDRREASCEDDEDRQRFLAALGEVAERYNWICHAYCLMTNHYPLLAETVAGNPPQGMRH